MEADKYTAGEVAVLVEGLRSDFRAVSEVVIPLREDMIEVKERLTSLENEVRSIKDVLRITLPDHAKRLTRIETHLHL